MTREELKEFFYNNVERYENFSEEILNYVYGESDVVPVNMKTHHNYRIDYFKEIKEELNGENSEMAKRMLYVISKVKRGNLCSLCSTNKDDINFLVLIGYDMQSILKETLLKSNSWFYGNEAHIVMMALAEIFEDEVCKMCDDFIKEDLSEYRKNCKDNNFIMKLTAVAVLLKLNKEKYSRYENVLVDFYKNEKLCAETIIILYHCYKVNEELKNIFKSEILSNPQVSLVVRRDCINKDNVLKLLKEEGLKTYPYYMLCAVDYGYDAEKAKVFKKLFAEDKTTFYETYEFIKKLSNEEYNSIFLLSIMLKNGEGKEQLEKDKSKFVYYTNRVLQRINAKENIYNECISDAENAKILISKLICNNEMNMKYGPYSDLIRIFSVLYDFDDDAKKFIDFFMENLKIKDELNMLCQTLDTFVKIRSIYLDADINEEVDKLLNKSITEEHLYKFLCISRNNYYLCDTIFDHELVCRYTKENQQKAVEFFDNKLIKNDIDTTLIWMEQLYNYAKISNCSKVLEFLNHKSKKIRNFCEKFISSNEENFRSDLENMMPKLKGDSLKLVKRVIKQWDNERKYGKDFEFKDNESVIEFVNENYDKDNEKLTKWLEDTSFENVKFKNSNETVPPIVIRFILNEYMALSEVYRIKTCDKIIEMLNIEDFRGVMCSIYNDWCEEGSDTKKKNIAVPYCIYSSDSEIIKMRKQLENWAKSSRGAIAAYIVNAIALNGGQVALMMVQSISEKFPNAMVKKSAKKAFAYASKVLGIPEDALCDKIVPDFGFDKYGEKIIDYGNRTFKVTLMEDFTLSIFDNEKNKNIKSLPKPNDKDDKEKSESAKKEFTQLKKQIKAVVKNQQSRLEQVYINGRLWDAEDWKSLFVENPIMQMFARKLIWGVYKDGKLQEAFRYMEDGTFNTIDEDEYELADNAEISLVHPCDLSLDEIQKWKTQLEDYDIIQPFEQLDTEVKYLSDEDIEGKEIIKYKGLKTTSGKLIKIFNKYNLLRGEVLDAGGFYCYHYIDKYLKVGVQINFEGMFVGIQDFDDEIDLETLIFYKLDEDFNDSPDDDIKESMKIDPKELSQKFVSSIISIIDTLI